MHKQQIKYVIGFILLAAILSIIVLPRIANASSAVDANTEVPPSSPVQVSLSLSNYPGVGQEATATLTVVAAWDMPDVVAKIELPGNSAVNAGQIEWSGSMRASEPLTLEAKVSFMQPGNYEIRGTALATESADASYSDVSYVYLTVGQDSGTEGYGPEASAGIGRTELVEAGDTSPVVDGGAIDLSQPTGPEPPSIEALAQDVTAIGPVAPEAAAPNGSLVVTGRWLYYNRANVQIPQDNYLVQLIRADNGAHLAWAYTNWNGYYTFPAVTNPYPVGIRVRVFSYVKYYPNNELMIVKLTGNVWSDAYNGTTDAYVFTDGTHTIGTWSMTSPINWPNNKAWWGKKDIDMGYRYPPVGPTGSTVEWSPASTVGTYYSIGGHVHLKAADLDNFAHTILHEFAHNVMYTIYGNYFPSLDCPSPHYIQRASALHCGWYEGWADFYPLAVLNDNSYRWPGGGTLNLETPTWYTTGWQNGATVEGRVAGTLLDIMDNNADAYDWYGEGFTNIWNNIYLQNDDNFNQYWSSWVARGYDQRHFRAAGYASTLDFIYRPKFSLSWSTVALDLDNHMWLPSAYAFHVYYGNLGSLIAPPWVSLDGDDTQGPGLENIIIRIPHPGNHVIAAKNWSGANIAGTGAIMRYWLGGYWQNTWYVPTTGTGSWWYVADFNGVNGGYTTRNLIQTVSPGPYSPEPESTTK